MAALSASHGAALCDSVIDVATRCINPRFDFTLAFEEVILGLIPTTLVALIVPLQLYRVRKQSRKVSPSGISSLKILVYITLIALKLALVVLWGQYDGLLPRELAVTEASARLASVIQLSVLSYFEHYRSIRPSTTISVSLLFFSLLDSAQCRTLWLLREQVKSIAPVFAAALGVTALLFLVEIREKQGILLKFWQTSNPEAAGSIVNRAFFWWVNSLLRRGYKRSLSPGALFELDGSLQSVTLLSSMTATWDQLGGSSNRTIAKHRLYLSVLNTVKIPLLKCILPQALAVAFRLAMPLLLNRTIRFVESERGTGELSDKIGYGLIAATGLARFGAAMATSLYEQNMVRALTMARGSLVSFIYHEALDLEQFSSNEKQGSDILTLTGRDVATMCSSIGRIHEIWSNIAQVGIAIYLLWMEAHAGFIGPVVPVIVCTILSSQISGYVGPAMKKWNEAIQTRVSTTSQMLGGIKEVKMLGLITSAMESLQGLRTFELNESKHFRRWIVLLNVLANTSNALAPIITIGIGLAFSDLSLATAFTSLAIIGLVSGPLSNLIHALPLIFSAFGSAERIQSFAEECERTKRRSYHSSHMGRQPDDGQQPPYSDAEPSTEVNRDAIINLHSVSFYVASKETPLLSEISLRIAPSTTTVIIGKIGSGKSILLQGILGQVEATGQVQLPGVGVAYCSQTPWLTNVSIRHNILGLGPQERSVDEDWYQTVLHACALDKDINRFGSGDSSLVGSKGLTLSGGQKQRIALARALYSRRPVLVADDVLSGLDQDTQSHVWTRVFGPQGLLKKQGVTVLLATHTLRYLEETDAIIVLENGRVAHHETFAKLQNLVSLPSLIATIKSTDERTQENGSQKEKEKANGSEGQRRQDDTEKHLEALRRSGDTVLYGYYFRSIGLKLGLLGIGLGIFFAIVEPSAQVWLKWWTESMDRGQPVDNGLFYGIYIALQTMGLATLGAVIYVMFVKIVPHSAENLHWTLLKTTLEAPLSFFAATDTGDLVNRFSEDMSLVDMQLPIAMFVTLLSLLMIVTSTLLIVIGAPLYSAGVIPVSVAFVYVIQRFYLRTSQQLRMLDLQSKTPLFAHMIETTEGLSTIKAFGWQSTAQNMALGLLDTSQQPHYLLSVIQRWLDLVLELYAGASAVILVWVAVATDISSAGGIALAMLNLLGFNSSLSELIASWTQLETSLGSIARLRTFEASTPKEIEPPTDKRFSPSHQWPQQGHIRIQHLSASYSSNPEAPLVLADINLDIQPGEKLAICGRTGSGKSSLLLTLFQLLNYSGNIEIDGISLDRLSPNDLRLSLISVPQEAVLFPGKLRANLTFGNSELASRTDAELIEALRKIELWDELSQKGGLDADIKSLGLSYGQRQLVCLARAMLRKNTGRVVILDEAMSAVDKETENLMIKLLETEFPHHTVISVAHRLDTVRGFNKAIIMDNGRISQIGSPAEILNLDS